MDPLIGPPAIPPGIDTLALFRQWYATTLGTPLDRILQEELNHRAAQGDLDALIF